MVDAHTTGLLSGQERSMAKRSFTLEFKESACALVTTQSYTPAKAARELGIAEMTLRSWLAARGWRGPQQQQCPDESDDPAVLKAHIRDLARRLAQSEMEKDILKKATAYFATQK
jgi:transposase